MSDEIEYMDIEEFIDEGYLQEVNRLVLHPAGLALETSDPWTQAHVEQWFREQYGDFDPDKITIEQVMAFVASVGLDKWHLSGVWDYRDDPEGMVFGDVDPAKRDRVRAEQEKHREARDALFGPEPQHPSTDYPARVQHVGENVAQS